MSHGRLDLVHYVYRSLPAWATNARLFHRIIERYRVDIAVGDEAFEVDVPLVVHVLRLKVPFVMIFDFVGTDAMTNRMHDRVGAWILNALWSLDHLVYAHGLHSAMFVGELEDVPSRPFGWALPNRRERTQGHYLIVGHVVGFDPADYADPRAWRRRLGYGEEPLVVCSAGGTSVGRDLLELCGAAAVPLSALMPGVRVVLVAGPRIDISSVQVPDGVEVLGYVPRLHELFAACDVAVVQCGGTTTTELAALGRPFLYSPIQGHFEQAVVAARLERHGVGKRLSLRSTSADRLAEMIFEEAGHAASTAMPIDGATKAAQHILGVLDRERTGHPGKASARCEQADRPDSLREQLIRPTFDATQGGTGWASR